MKTYEKRVLKDNASIIIDNSLKELNKQNLFPEKVKKAEETIARIGLPKPKIPKN